MKYLFILGRLPTLSVAELVSVFQQQNISYKIIAFVNEVLILDLAPAIKNEEEFINQLGGTVKIAQVIEQGNRIQDLKDKLMPEKLLNHYPKITQELKTITYPKLLWGISVYFLCPAKLHKRQKIKEEIQSFLIGAKKKLIEQGFKVRIVTPPPSKLSLDSAAVWENKLLNQGGEIICAVDRGKIYLAKTLAIQDFKSYSRRDYDRPARNMKIGMMPPKLAQMMVNFSKTPLDGTIFDPFCGLGTIPQEGLLMGYKVIGSDIQKKMIGNSRKNLEWLKRNYKLSGVNYQLFCSDVKEISKFINPNSIDAIVTEGILGPLYSKQPPTFAQINKIFSDLKNIYYPAFREFKKVLKENGRIVITFPTYLPGGKAGLPAGEAGKIGEKLMLFGGLDEIKNIGYTVKSMIPRELKQNPTIESTERETLLYWRPGQIVRREIVVFEKNING